MERQEERAYIRRYARRSWPRFWCSMVRHNLVACVTDVLEGIRAPSVLRRRKGATTHWTVGCRCLLCPCPCPRLRARRRGSAAATVPVPATPASRNVPFGGFDANKEEEQADRRRKGWTLPPKLRAAGEGAGAWGTEIGSSSTLKLSATDGHSSGGRHQHCHGRGGSAASETTGAGSVCNTGRSNGSYYNGGGGDGGGQEDEDLRLRRPGGGSSGRSISTSIFATTPVSSDFPRKKDFGGGNEQEEEEEEKVDRRLRRTGGGGSGGGSGRPIITSMFATTPTPVASDFPRKKGFTWSSVAEGAEDDDDDAAASSNGGDAHGGA